VIPRFCKQSWTKMPPKKVLCNIKQEKKKNNLTRLTLTTWVYPPPFRRKKLPEITVSHGGNMPFIQDQTLFQTKLLLNRGCVEKSRRVMARRFGLPATCPYGYVAKGSAGGPVPLAALAEMPRLINVVVVEVAKLGFHALASWTWYDPIRSLFCPIFTHFVIFWSSFSTMQGNRCSKELNPFTGLAYLGHFRRREQKRGIIPSEEGLGWGCRGRMWRYIFIYAERNKAKKGIIVSRMIKRGKSMWKTPNVGGM